MSKKRRSAYLALSLMALIWGPAFIFVKPAFSFISPTQFLYFRFLVASLVAFPVLIWHLSRQHPHPRQILKYICIELLGIPIPLLFLYEGLSRTTAINAAMIGATTPIFIVLGGIIFLREHETRREWQGLAISLLGSLILVAAPLLHDGVAMLSMQTGNLFILAYNLLWTAYILLAKHIYKTKPPLAIGGITYSLTTLIFAVKLFLSHATAPLILLTIPSVALAVGYMGIIGTIAPFALTLYATSRIEASEASLFTYLQGILAIPFAALLLHEYPSPLTFVAIALVAYGVYRAEFRKR